MKDEYDFSNAEQGKFYRPLDDLEIPIYLDKKRIKEIANKIAKIIKPKKIILFGSYAYGNPNEYSGIDLCIIEESYDSKMNEKKKIRDILSDIKGSFDILVPTLKEYNFYKSEYGSVYKDIEEKGVVIWSS